MDCHVPDDIMQLDLESFFESLPWGDLWEDANMVSPMRYLRASKSLQLGSLRRLFPTEI